MRHVIRTHSLSVLEYAILSLWNIRGRHPSDHQNLHPLFSLGWNLKLGQADYNCTSRHYYDAVKTLSSGS